MVDLHRGKQADRPGSGAATRSLDFTPRKLARIYYRQQLQISLSENRGSPRLGIARRE